jgi:carbon-monoxide dehydrogenase medium subunit
LGARVKLLSVRGERIVPLDKFFLGPGQTVLAASEILWEVIVPSLPERSGGAYLKLKRTAKDIALVGVAAVVTLDADGVCRNAELALGAVAPTPLRVDINPVVKGKILTPDVAREASRLAAQGCSPIDDVRASAWYRRAMVEVLVGRALLLAGERAKRGGGMEDSEYVPGRLFDS